AEGITLVLLITSVAAWATPIRRHLGPGVLAHAIRVALPVAVALQWGLRSRYLARPGRSWLLGRRAGRDRSTAGLSVQLGPGRSVADPDLGGRHRFDPPRLG